MNFKDLSIAVVLLAISVFCKLSDIPPSSILTQPILLINFYHPQCSKCKQALPQLIQLYELSVNSQYQFSQINCAKQSGICDSLKITYPAIFLFVQGNQIPYEGEITAKKLDNWMRSLINCDFPMINSEKLEQKLGKQSFVLIGGLNKTQRIQAAATKLSRYIGIEFYEILSAKKIFSLYVTDQNKIFDLTFPVNTSLFAYNFFHLTREHILNVNKPEYLEYFRKQKESEQIFILYDVHDKFSYDATPVFDKLCHRHVLDIICFRVQKQSEVYEELAGNFQHKKDRSSIIYHKRSKQMAYIYRDKQFIQKNFQLFVNQAKDDKRNPDFEQGKQTNYRMKSQNVLNIDGNAHNKLIKNNQIVLIEYYSPVLKSCSNLVPEYDAVGQYFKEIGSPIVIASLNADQQLILAAEQQVQKYPAFKVFVGGEGFHYDGRLTKEAIISYLTHLSNANLPSVSDIKDVRRPALTISGIHSTSTLHKLPVFFNSLPIFELIDQNFRINLLKQDGQVDSFTGNVSLIQILDWLEEKTGPVLVSLGDSKVPKKLKAAMKKFKPILGLIDKGKQGSINSSIQLLTKYCLNKKDIICGILKKGEDDYENLMKWIGDSDHQANRLVWIDFKQLKHYIYKEDITSLDEKKIDDFISGIQKGGIKQQKFTKIEEKQQRLGYSDNKSMNNQSKLETKATDNQL